MSLFADRDLRACGRAGGLVLLTTVLAPLPLGANRPWAWNTMAVLIALAALWRAWRGPSWPRLPGFPVLAGLWLAAIGWAAVQGLPGLPAAWAHPAWAWVAGGTGGTVAIDPALALSGAGRLLTYGLAFAVVAVMARDARAALAVVRTLAVAAAAYALYGLAIRLSGAETLLWWDKWAYRGVLTATFVNRNAAASLFGLGLLTAVAWTLRRPTARVPLGCAALSLGALLLTESRAGVASAGLGLLVLLGAVAGRRRGAGLGGRRAAWAGLGLVLVGLLAGGGVALRLVATDLGAIDRAPVHAAVLAAIAERPGLGQGLGGFDLAFAAHRPQAVAHHWDQAHSSYLENAYELGLPAAAALYGALGGAAALCAAGVLRRRQRLAFPALGLAAAVQAAAHATVDFTFQHPANALWLAVLLAVGGAQASPRRGPSASAPRARLILPDG